MSLWLCVFPILILVVGLNAQAQREFGSSFEQLKPPQRRLIEQLVERYNQTTGDKLAPSAAFDKTRLSVRTTFDAITHALLTTPLTAAGGVPAGTALELVEAVEEVAGEIRGVGGDRQFRMYVVLKADAVERLAGSVEFGRGPDNTVFHKGFPICYRSKGGAPSIQVSIARDGKRADIDVDYWSSSIPASMFNGHLRAANSDVRAGNNAERHQGRWRGFSNWWTKLFAMEGADSELVARQEAGPSEPKVKASAPLADAVHDLLKAWIVDRDVDRAMPYFSRRSNACVDAIFAKAGRPVVAGMSRVAWRQAMQTTVTARPGAKAITDVVRGLKPWRPDLKVVAQKYEDEFLLLNIPRSVVEESDCERMNQGLPPITLRNSNYGQYYASAFRTRTAAGADGVLYMIWTKEAKFWKVVAFTWADDADPDFVKVRNAKMAPPIQMERIAGDPRLVKEVTEFYTVWLLKGNVAKAMSSVSVRAAGCVDALAGADPLKKLEEGMAATVKAVGRARRLGDAVSAVGTEHELLKVVTHPNEKAFGLFAGPESLAAPLLCETRNEPRMIGPMPLGEYGKYYGSTVKLNLKDGEGSVLQTIWAEEGGRWKVVAFQLIEP